MPAYGQGVDIAAAEGALCDHRCGSGPERAGTSCARPGLIQLLAAAYQRHHAGLHQGGICVTVSGVAIEKEIMSLQAG